MATRRGHFEAKGNFDFITRQLTGVGKQAPFLQAYSLTKTAKDIKDAEYRLMEQVFDRPTSFTLRSLYVDRATPSKLVAVVEYRPGFGKSTMPAWRYLGPQVDGGGRAKKSHEKALERAGILKSDEWAVPSSVLPVDGQGNVPGKVFVQILSQLQASRDASQNMTQKSRKRATAKAGGRFFVRRDAGVPDGVYQRRADKAIVPVLLFVRQPRYTKRFPFYEKAEQVYRQRVAVNYRDGFNRFIVKPLKVA